MADDPLPPLTGADFPDYFRALWGDTAPDVAPFPWQLDLVGLLAEERRWPELVDLPTGSGKTSLLDIAVFMQALDAESPARERWMPRRVALVVDRRVVVDQADARGARLRRALAQAGDGVLRRVADRLRHLSGGGPPLVTSVLRGGIVRDETWAQRPDVPAIISSTVDQVGSRLLFRGYGVSPGMQPIHAGLLANDTLFLLDEVHLAQPFAATLQAVEVHRRRPGNASEVLDEPASQRWGVVQLSATPSATDLSRFPSGPIAETHPVLRRRLQASKPASLSVVKVPKDEARANDKFAAACLRGVKALLGDGQARTIGVVVNRVDRARRVARLLVADGTEVCLVTGRMRPIDRDRLLDQQGPRLRTGRRRDAGDSPLVVVATQSIEAGADFDLDGIVTECASLDALRQRFGRVDRDGALAAAGMPSRSVVLVRSTDVDAVDPVYGEALSRTWRWLHDQPLVELGTGGGSGGWPGSNDERVVDFGIDALAVPDGDELRSLVPAPSRAPLLLPNHLDQWVQRSQPGALAEPEVSRWLHGIDADEQLADVDVVWRSDLDASLFGASALDGAGGERVRQGIIDRVAACPPTSGETLAIPIGAFRRWVAERRRDGRAPADLVTADAPTVELVEPTSPNRTEGAGRVLRWTGTTGEVVSPDRINPGDTVVLPSSAGGVWLGNWDPSELTAVSDLGADAVAQRRRLAVARLVRAGASPLREDRALSPDPDELAQLPSGERAAVIRDVLGHLVEHPTVAVPQRVAEHLARPGALTVRAFPEAVQDDGAIIESYVVWSKRPMAAVRADDHAASAIGSDEGDDAPSFTGAGEIALHDHLEGVGDWAERLAGNLGLADDVVADLGLAGRLHDAGKVDPRFQRWLHDGDETRVKVALRPLAKSSVPDTDRRRRRQARHESGYPDRARHEMLSLAMIAEPSSVLDGAHDPELVRYLVTSHHGYGRYRFDPVGPARGDSLAPTPTPTPTVGLEIAGVALEASADYGLARLDRGVPDRFWSLVGRYGWFGLAWLETILRLADHERSRRERAGTIDWSDEDDEGRDRPAVREDVA